MQGVPMAGGNRSESALFASQRRVLRLALPCSLDQLCHVRSFIESAELTARLDTDRIFDMKVAVSEAVANAIEHAGASVRVWMWLLPDRVVVEVVNKGRFGTRGDRGFSERRRGFGLRLMVSLADEVSFIGARRDVTKVRLTFLHRPVEKSALFD